MRTGITVTGLLAGAMLQAQVRTVQLHEGWFFREVGTGEWHPARVPGVVHEDLFRQGLIPDPLHASNADSLRWIEERDWEYRLTFRVDGGILRKPHVDLVFKGIDTHAEVHLNDSLLGRTDNMFRSWEWPVSKLLRAGDNELRVVLRSAVAEGAKVRAAYGIQLPHDSDPSGVAPYVRKAAYQFGWDFAPRLVTCGIWQEVQLRAWDKGRLKNVRAAPWPESTASFSSATLVRMRTFSDVPDGTEIAKEFRFGEVHGGNSGRHGPQERLVGEEVDATVLNVPLWEPGRSMEARLQPASVRLLVGDSLQDSWNARLGVRTLQLDQEKDSIGHAFRFLVNDKPTFMKGCNLVPPTMLLHGGQDSLWVARVRDMQRAGMNMVRVWAGGVYPPDAFFHACDSAGILVWQDLMFAYPVPGDEAGIARAVPEVNEQLARLWNHPSLALFCGNNELDVAWNNWGWQRTYRIGKDQEKRLSKEYKGFFDERLREAVEWGALYTPTSPLSNWGNAEGLRNGDLHYWGVWHADSTFGAYRSNVGRFVSEYGFQSYPDSATLATQIEPRHLYLGSPELARRQRSYRTDKPIHAAIEREFAVKPRTLGEFILFSQLAQAEAYRQAIWAHVTGRPHCMGTLFWQLNDVWAGPSWSTVDHTGRWKAAMYEVARSYRPVVIDLSVTKGRVVASLWNERPDLKHARRVLQVFTTDGRMVHADTTREALGTGLNAWVDQPLAALVGTVPLDSALVRVGVLDNAGAVIAERTLALAPWGRMAWMPSDIRMERVRTGATTSTYRLSCDRPVPVVWLEAPGAAFSDDHFPLLPGTPREVVVTGTDERPRLNSWP